MSQDFLDKSVSGHPLQLVYQDIGYTLVVPKVWEPT